MHTFLTRVAAPSRLLRSAPWLAVAALLSACGGGDSLGTAAKPQMRLSITTTEDVPGTWGSVGAYEKVTGTLHGEVDPAD
ncbi:MAG: hypothetical protein KGM60_15040, partial [Comamonadaceae bacterium]|nr:hypothetical protein [Comamonadaceae bacterium]